MLRILRYKDTIRPLSIKENLLKVERRLDNVSRNENTLPPTLPSTADVVIIGGGSAGCSTLFQLAKRGVNAILLEKAKITAGETWHSAGLILQMRMSDTEMQLRSATRSLLSSLQQETGVDPKWINNGAIYLARSKIRMEEYKRMSTLAKNFNIETQLLSPEETKALFPLLDTSLVTGSLFCPSDGVVDPTAYCQAMYSSAKNAGSQIIEDCPVTKIITGKSEFGYKQVEAVATPYGEIKTKCVVNASGAWSGKIAEMAGLDIPIVPLLHAYVVSSPMSLPANLPNIKDSDGRVYFRVKGDTMCVGGFEHNPILLDQLSYELYDLDWKVFDAHMQHAVEIVPDFETAGIKTTVCGTETFTPDLKPLMGEDPRLIGFFHMCGFNASGVVLSGGCGEQLAKWIVEGRPDIHMYSYDIRRFTPEQLANKAWAKERSHESYVNNYKIVYPHDDPMAGRNLKQDPFYEELLVAGAVYEQAQGYERPGWFNPNGYSPVPPYDWYGAYGTPRNLDKRYTNLLKGDKTFGFSKHHLAIGSECLACREQVVMMDFSYFCKMYMIGPETQEAADWLFTQDTNVPIDQIVYTCLLNERGKIEADLMAIPITPGTGTMANPIFKTVRNKSKITVLRAHTLASLAHESSSAPERARFASVWAVLSHVWRLSDKTLACFCDASRMRLVLAPPQGRGMYIVAAGASASQTRAHIMSVIKKKGFQVDIADFSSKVGLLAIQGPASRELLQNLVDCDLRDEHFPYKTSRIIKLAGIEVRAMRTSFVGELGWEIHVPEHACIPVYLALWEVGRNYGLRHAGYRALYSLCSEKGYRLWNSDVRADDNPIEAGLGYTCRAEGDYLGKAAVEEALQTGIKKRHVFITIDDPVPMYGMETLWRNGEIVGYLRRGEYGFSLGCSIAQGYVACPNGENITSEFIESGDYEVEILGVKHKANIHLKSPFDPENKRLQGIYDEPLPIRQNFGQ